MYTKQREEVLNILLEKGRFTCKKEFVEKSEEASLMLFAYDEMMKYHPKLKDKPKDADYPIWLSYSLEAVQLSQPGFVTLKLEIDEKLITDLNIIKWTMVNNCAYIPSSSEDEKRHKELLKAFNVSDAKAYNSRFYPDIKREIEDSRKRLFDPSYNLGSSLSYGLIWELRKEQLADVLR